MKSKDKKITHLVHDIHNLGLRYNGKKIELERMSIVVNIQRKEISNLEKKLEEANEIIKRNEFEKMKRDYRTLENKYKVALLDMKENKRLIDNYLNAFRAKREELQKANEIITHFQCLQTLMFERNTKGEER